MGVQCGFEEVLKNIHSGQEQYNEFLRSFALFPQTTPTKI